MSLIAEYREHLLERYILVVSDLEALVSRLSYEQVHGEQGQHIRRVVVHLYEVEERIIAPCVERILNEDRPLLVCPAEDAPLSRKVGMDEPIETGLGHYRELRCKLLEKLRAISPLDWNRTGRHPRLGVRTLQWWVEQSLAHSRGHLQRISIGGVDERLHADID